MADFENLSKLLGDTEPKAGPKVDMSRFDDGENDDVDPEDSGSQVFNSAAQEAFHALKDGDIKAFTEALKTAITGNM